MRGGFSAPRLGVDREGGLLMTNALPDTASKVTGLSPKRSVALQKRYRENMMTAATSQEKPDKPSSLALLKAAFRNRKVGIMLVFGFSAGLPYTLLIGTLNAWLIEEKVTLATIGILSWIGLAYAFKFLWSPLVDRLAPPGFAKLGRRRSWLLLCQIVLAFTFMALSFMDPTLAIDTFALVAFIGAFFSATQDVVIDAWRIDVADETANVDLLSTSYQFGYRIAALIGGALALIFAARVSWPTVYFIMGLLMFAPVIATLFAPDTPRNIGDDAANAALSKTGAIEPHLRAIGLSVVSIGWIWAIYTIGSFMTKILMADPADPNKPIAGDFVKYTGPWIVVATVIIPAIVAALLNYAATQKGHILQGDIVRSAPQQRFVDHAYAALILPLAELIQRLRWGALLVLCLILTYRICDSIWGPFAFPFYLEELKYTKDEVAFASKIFGTIMTIVGISVGGLMLLWIGRMPTVIICAIVAALSNLLYADLALGGPYIDAFANATGINSLAGWLGTDARMTRLLFAISGENIAGGMAGAAFIAYLSSITSKEHSAVQFALLSSLTFLVGSLGRGALGEMIEKDGYPYVFSLTAAIGAIAVVFSILEWMRQKAMEKDA
jgi:MFS transporter, PAT family, beta-lactamase induction signal transducer AmpG